MNNLHFDNLSWFHTWYRGFNSKWRRQNDMKNQKTRNNSTEPSGSKTRSEWRLAMKALFIFSFMTAFLLIRCVVSMCVGGFSVSFPFFIFASAHNGEAPPTVVELFSSKSIQIKDLDFWIKTHRKTESEQDDLTSKSKNLVINVMFKLWRSGGVLVLSFLTCVFDSGLLFCCCYCSSNCCSCVGWLELLLD